MPRDQRRTKAGGRHSPGRPVTAAELRGELASWSHAELVDFVMETIDRDAAARRRVEARLLARRDAGAAAEKLRADIDEALDIGFVEWRDVPAYVEELEDLLATAEELGKTAPDDALEVVWHFIAAIPEIFDRVHVECELEMFCESLAQTAMALAAQSDRPARDTVTRLLDAFRDDDHGQFGAVPDVLAATPARVIDRGWLAEEVMARREGADAYQAEKLDGLLRTLRGGTGRTKRKSG